MKLIAILISPLIVFVFSHVQPHETYRKYDGMQAVSVVASPPPTTATASSWPDQIRLSLARAGFREDQLDIMMAISKAESGWRIDAIGDVDLQDKTWGPSVGVLQIRTLKTNAKGCRDYHSLWGNLDAQTSCAKQIYDKQGYKAWSVYLNGAYRQFLNV